MKTNIKQLKKIIKEEADLIKDPISPSGEMVSRGEMINKLRDNLILALTQIEIKEEINYELVMLLDVALERAKAITGKAPFEP
tara:strand:+ start:58 stop:306 length:249 start_codon:yes stop_codon:yes gene_type:complete